MKNFNAILKNSNKFNSNIKLASGLIVDYNNRKDREGETGVSTEKFGQFWFKTVLGDVLVKDITRIFSHGIDVCNIAVIKAFNEVLCYNLLKQMGINCAKYIPADVIDYKTRVSQQALASVNFLKNDDKLLPLKELCGISKKDKNMVSIMKIIEEKGSLYAKKINYKQIFYSLYSYVIFDLITCQNDRNWGNISFIIDKNSTMTLAPIYDNEYSFFADTFLFLPDEMSDINDYFNNYFVGNGIMTPRHTSDAYGISGFDEIANQIIDMAQKDKKCDKILKHMLKNANLDSIYKKLTEKGYEIDENYQEFTCQVLNFTRNRMVELYKDRSSKKSQEMER